MARSQYPSDHRRYFRVMEDILDDPGYRNLNPRDQVRWIDLLARFNRQRAHRTGDMIVLPWSRVLELFGRSNRAQALQTLVRLRCAVSAHFVVVPEGVLCYIPKWSKLQGLTPTRLRCVSVATPSPTPTPTPTPIKKESAADAAPISASSPRGNGRPKRTPMTAFPEPFPLDLRAKLQQWAERNRFTADQVDFAIQTVADWAVSNDKTKASWVRTIQGAMRAGWALNRKPGAGSVKQENTRREYLLFDSPEWKRANDCGD
jgi:hypothetical protein